MLTKKVQAISGVSPGFESVVEELYPSIACTGIGGFLNRLYECIPIKIWGVKISHVFALLTAPIGVAMTEKEKTVLRLAGKITAQQIADAETNDLPPPWRLACQMVVRDEDILVKF